MFFGARICIFPIFFIYFHVTPLFLFLGIDIDWRDYYNQVPDRASTFKGRVLCKFRLMDKRPEKRNTPEVKPFKLKIGPTARLTPKVATNI